MTEQRGAAPGWGLALLLALGSVSLSVLAGACSTGGGSAQPPAGTRAWPPEDPRVRLEAVIEARPSRRRLGAVFGSLAGARERPGLIRPYGVAWDGDGLLVTDPGAGRLIAIDARGRTVRAAAFESPIGVARCPEGVVATDSRAGLVALLDSSLHLRRLLAEDLDRPTGVACRAGEIFVAETGAHRIVVLAAGSGSPERIRVLGRRGDGPGELYFPTSLALDGDALWVGDTLNFRVQRLDPVTGEPMAEFGRLGDAPGELPRLKGMAVDSLGAVWVADAHLDRVALFRADGTFLLALGRPGSAPGELSFPAGIAAHPDGRVAVVDSLNRRIQVFRRLPPPEGKAAP